MNKYNTKHNCIVEEEICLRLLNRASELSTAPDLTMSLGGQFVFACQGKR